MTHEQKDAIQYVNNKAKLIKLILEHKDQIFDYPPANLENKIEIENVEADIKNGWLSFRIKVKASADPNGSVLVDQKISLWGFGKFGLKDLIIELSGLTQEQKEGRQYVNDHSKLVKLIFEKKDQIFETNGYYNLTDEKQIQITSNVRDFTSGELSFRIKVKDSADPNASVLIDNKDVWLAGFERSRFGR